MGCGTRQRGAAGGPNVPPPPPGGMPPPPPGAAGFAGANSAQDHANEFLKNLSNRKASMICYIPVVGWVGSVVVLAAEKFRHAREVRFHAFQGLYLFVLWLFVDWVFGPLTSHMESTRFIGEALKAAVMVTWIFMLVKTNQGENFHLPILGELAERSVSEQR